MSLILEALNKAEHERSGDDTQATAATYSMSVADTNWWRILSFIILAIGIAAFSIYLSMPFFSPQTKAPTIRNQVTDTQIENHQETIEQPSTVFAPESIESTVNTTAKEEPATPHDNIDNDDAIRLEDIASTSEQNHIPADIETKTANTYRQGTTTTEKRKQQRLKAHIEPTQTTNTDTSISLDSRAHQTVDKPPVEEAHLGTPIFQNLPPGIKSQLPNLELNIHVYSTNPSKSFVYINSKRYRESATIGNGITLERIIPTGVILRHQETLFRLIIET
jgi:hypothetical protein